MTPTPSRRHEAALARPSNVLQRPPRRQHAHLDVSTNIDGPISTHAPPASARSLSPSTRLLQACAMATRELEQAVSSDTAGPVRSSNTRCAPQGSILPHRAGCSIALGNEIGITARPRPDEHAAGGTSERCRINGRIFDRMPSVLQEQALLRIHQLRLARRDVEEADQTIHTPDRTHPLAIGRAGSLRIGS